MLLTLLVASASSLSLSAQTIVISTENAAADTVILLKSDETRLYVASLDGSETSIIDRSSIKWMEFNLDVDLRDSRNMASRDRIETQDGQSLDVIILDLNSRWVSYTVPDTGRRHVIPQQGIAQLFLSGEQLFKSGEPSTQTNLIPA